jgi:dTMP kinase
MIRSVFSGKMKADHKTIAGLFVADRLHHILNEEDGMLKKLQEGYIVISDRYYFSSYAYHSVHMDMDWVIQANAMSAEMLRPDLNIFIDVSPETSMTRINQGREEVELYETLENLISVREQYEIAFERLMAREHIVRFSGEQNQEALADQIYDFVSKMLP